MRTEQSWEDRFKSWSGGPGDTELEQCDNAERMVRKAVAQCPILNKMTTEVFAQGSFRNNTNIAQESDIDISVCLTDYMYYELPVGASPTQFDITPGDREFGPYKDSVLNALECYFGKASVTRGDKAIRVHSNTYRIDADVVANWQYKEYFDPAQPDQVRVGVKFQSDPGVQIINYPKQHTAEGIAKNDKTSRRFKKMVRILKSLQAEMFDQDVIKKKLSSFFVESLVFNVPNPKFGATLYRDDVWNILAYICDGTRPAEDCSKWMEANDVKFLFHPLQPWTKTEANELGNAMWDYIGLPKS